MQADNENIQEQAPTDSQMRYLGDGVYASFDGYGLQLDLRGQDDFTRIALEPLVLVSLFKYARSIYGEELFKT